jgi:hypothetical protein
MRHFTTLHCIFADGSYAKPLVVTSRKTVALEIFTRGYTPDKLDIQFQESGFVTRDMFLDWVITILFPEIRR